METTRITDRENATNNTFGFINRNGQFEARNLKEYLTELGIYSETADKREMSADLKAYYTKLKQIVDTL